VSEISLNRLILRKSGIFCFLCFMSRK